MLRRNQSRSRRAVIRPIRVCDLSGIEGWDWLSYLTVKYRDIPEVKIVVINRPELGYLGAGEASLVPVPAVIANAIFDATGAHVHDIPVTPERVLAALEPSNTAKPA